MAATEYCDGVRANLYFNVANRHAQKVVIVPTALKWDNTAFADPRKFDDTPGIPMDGGQERAMRLYIGTDYPYTTVRPDTIRHFAVIVDYGWIESKKSRIWLVRDSGMVTGRGNGISTGFQCNLNVTIPRDRPDISGSWRISGFTDSRGVRNTVYIERTTPDMSSTAILAAVRNIIRRTTSAPVYAQTLVLASFTPSLGTFSAQTETATLDVQTQVEEPTDVQLATVFGSVGEIADLEASATSTYSVDAPTTVQFATVTAPAQEPEPEVFIRHSEPIVTYVDEPAAREPLYVPREPIAMPQDTSFGADTVPIASTVLDEMDTGLFGPLLLVADPDLGAVGIASGASELEAGLVQGGGAMLAPTWLPDVLKSSSFADLLARVDLVFAQAGWDASWPILRVGGRCTDMSIPIEQFGMPDISQIPGSLDFARIMWALELTQPLEGPGGSMYSTEAGTRARAEEVFTSFVESQELPVYACADDGQEKKAGLPVGTIAVAALGAALLFNATRK
jgi:hypothetical protein